MVGDAWSVWDSVLGCHFPVTEIEGGQALFWALRRSKCVQVQRPLRQHIACRCTGAPMFTWEHARRHKGYFGRANPFATEFFVVG